jgi:hypothetical protein
MICEKVDRSMHMGVLGGTFSLAYTHIYIHADLLFFSSTISSVSNPLHRDSSPTHASKSLLQSQLMDVKSHASTSDCSVRAWHIVGHTKPVANSSAIAENLTMTINQANYIDRDTPSVT